MYLTLRQAIVVVGLIATLCTPVSAQATVNRGAWLEDHAVLKHAIETQYSNLAWFASPAGGVNLPALDRRTIAAITAAQSDDDARSAVLAFVAGFHDGHFARLQNIAGPLETQRAEPKRQAFTLADPATGCAALGYTLTSPVAFSTTFESLPGFHLMTDGIAQTFRAGVVTTDDGAKVGIVRIPQFRTSSHPALCLAAWSRSLWDANDRFTPRFLTEKATTAWYDALSQTLKQFKALDVTAVVVDVGDNSGGDDSGDIAARLFSSIQLRSAPLWMSQDSAASDAYFVEQLGDLHRARDLASDATSRTSLDSLIVSWTDQRAKLSGPACSMTWVWQVQRPWQGGGCRRLVEAGSAAGPVPYLAPNTVQNERVAKLMHWPAQVAPQWGSWTGPLYVLTNGRTYSSAEMFSAVLQNNRAARTIGSRTGGDGCGFMNSPKPVVLPHSQLRFQLPNCVRLRADSTDEVAGVAPDIPVLPAEGESGRQRAQRMIDLIVKDAHPVR